MVRLSPSDRGLDGVCVSNIVLKSSLRNYDGLRLCHFNGRSIFYKMDQIRAIFSNVGFNVIGITETWLKSHNFDSAICIEDYNIFRNDRKSHAGGVLLYVRRGIGAKVLLKSSSNSVEYIFMEINVAEKKFLIGVVYNSKSTNDLSSLFSSLSYLSSEYSDVIVFGDFNRNLLNGGVKLSFINEISGSNIFIVPSDMPTHYSSTSSSLLDFFLTSNLSRVKFMQQISLPGVSDHDLIYMVYKCPQLDRQNLPIYYRDYRSIDYSRLLEAASGEYWDEIYSLTDVDSMVCKFNGIVLSLFERFVPVKRVIKNTGVPQ